MSFLKQFLLRFSSARDCSQVLFLASKDVKSSKIVQLLIAVVNAVQLWIFPLRLLTLVRFHFPGSVRQIQFPAASSHFKPL